MVSAIDPAVYGSRELCSPAAANTARHIELQNNRGTPLPIPGESVIPDCGLHRGLHAKF